MKNDWSLRAMSIQAMLGRIMPSGATATSLARSSVVDPNIQYLGPSPKAKYTEIFDFAGGMGVASKDLQFSTSLSYFFL